MSKLKSFVGTLFIPTQSGNPWALAILTILFTSFAYINWDKPDHFPVVFNAVCAAANFSRLLVRL